MFNERYECGVGQNSLILENGNTQDAGYKSIMLIKNRIPGFLKCSIYYMDGKEQYVYDVTSRVSIYSAYEKSLMDYGALYDLLGALAMAFESAEEYLLPPEHLLLDPKHIYRDTQTGSIYFCYYPGTFTEIRDGMYGFAEYILKVTDHTDDAAVTLAYDFYKQVVNEDYTIRRLLKNNETRIEVRTEEQAEDYRVDDDSELYNKKPEARTDIPFAGKIIILSSLLLILIMSGFVASAVIYEGGFAASLLELAELKVFISLTCAMAMLVPLLIVIRWVNENGIFIKVPDTDNTGDDEELFRNMMTEREGHIGNTLKLN